MAKAAPPQVSEAELREAFVRSESLRQQLAAMESQQQLIADLVADTTRALVTVEAVEKGSPDDEMLVPVGAGTFLHAKLTRTDIAITTLGSAVSAQLPVADVARRLRERVESLNAAAHKGNDEMGRLLDEMGRLNAILEAAQGA